MKVIDIHLHIGHVYEWSKEAVKLWMDTGDYRKKVFDKNGRLIIERYVEILKQEGVGGGILLPEYSPLTAGTLPVEEAIEFSEKFPEFIPFANINPNVHLFPLKELKRQLNLGCKGLKLHPVHGLFYVNEKILYPVYEFCTENQIPVMMHAGSSIFPGTKLRYADPYTFDDVAADFPDLTIILCHAGRGFWYHIAEFLIRRHENVYIDISGLPPKNLLKYYPNMDKFSEKFLFGTDFPGVPSIKRNVETINNLPLKKQSIENILFKNATKILNFW